MSDGVAALERRHERAALAFLDRDPVANVFLTWLIESNRSSVGHPGTYVYLRGADVAGVAFFGRQVVLAAQDDDVTSAFAEIPAARSPERMIVAERPVAQRYWECVREWHRPPRAVRDSQPVFSVDRESLNGNIRSGVRVRRAEARDLRVVAENSAAMIEHELEYDPRTGGAAFDAGVRSMIDRGLWWLGEFENEYCFFMNAGAQSAYTLQLQGIWTPPPMRSKGLATAALSQICSLLLADVPTLSLYVNAFNTPAIALYERTGFVRAGEFATYLF
ncbi:MAG TPA: GNAT family N-acetyltransferase [Candidatus Baltobacteraceae bacterium]|nr:GNAT family N-acetyltransferase [Candidatus Baltobacteraceae bacterium]